MSTPAKLASAASILVTLALACVPVDSVVSASNWIPFLGRFHPVILHLPIGLFVGIVLLELCALARPAARIRDALPFLLNATFYSAVLSAVLGILLSWEGGYESGALDRHKWVGVATLVGLYGLLFLRTRDASRSQSPPLSYFAGIAATVGLVTATGHFGGTLTHGSGFLTQFNPFSPKSDDSTVATNASVYASHIKPIFEDYCIECHSPEKMKGELRLDTVENLLAGGLSGPAIEPGESEASRLIHALRAPIEADEHMPPKGKPQPSDEIIELLSWWIDQGAKPDALLADLQVTPVVASHFLEVEPLELLPFEVVDPQRDELSKSTNVFLAYLSQEDSRLSARAKTANDADLDALKPIIPNIVELNLGGSQITDEGLGIVGEMTNLTHIHLNNTAITDAGIAKLANLYQLEYINLYGTSITDESLLTLRRLKNLKKIYLWNTDVSADAIAALRKSIFQSVESEKLRVQIQELTKKRENLEVEIVSAFDSETEPAEDTSLPHDNDSP